MNIKLERGVDWVYSVITNPIKYIYFTMVADILIAPLFAVVNSIFIVVFLVIWVWTAVVIHRDREVVEEHTGWKPNLRFYFGAVPLWGIVFLAYYILQRKALYKRAEELEEHESYSIES
jgi:hypothetical protein